jgi:hypothetical protein
MRLASNDLELNNEAHPYMLSAIEDWMGFVGSTCVVEAGLCCMGASLTTSASASASAVFGVSVSASTRLALASSDWEIPGASVEVD